MGSLVFTVVTPTQEKLLGKSALSLYRVLRHLRGRASVTQGFTRTLPWLCFETDLENRTAKRGLSRLRDCGALRTSRRSDGSHNFYVRGKIVRGTIWLPESFQEWCVGRQRHGGIRKQDVPSLKQNEPRKSNDTEVLLRQDVPSIVHNYEHDLGSSFSFGERRGLRPCLGISTEREQCPSMTKWPAYIQHALDRGSITEVEAELLLPRPDDPKPARLLHPFTIADLNASLGEGMRRLRQHRQDNPRPSRQGPAPVLPPLCPVRKVKLGYEEIEAGRSGKVMVSRVLQGYEEAVSAVYGAGRSRAWFKGVKDLRARARLLEAAKWLQANGIAPGAWAHWRLTYAKTQQRHPWGPTRVFIASQMVKWEQWFLDTYDGPQGVAEEWTDAHREQRFRHEEAIALWENKSPNALRQVGAPWYREMRAAEISRGMIDPLDGYMKV